VKPAVSGAASGVVIGVSAVILLQQLAWISLSDLVTGLTYLIVAALAAGIVFGIGGWILGRSAMQRAKAMLANELTASGATTPPIVSDSQAKDADAPSTSSDSSSADPPKST
jgi:ABC-type Fe3+ transport system permease subunit